MKNCPSSETQGQRVGARESLNGRKNMAQRKVKNGKKSPWGQCLTRQVPNGRRRSEIWLGRKTQKFSGTNQNSEQRRRSTRGLKGTQQSWLLLFALTSHWPLPSYFAFLASFFLSCWAFRRLHFGGKSFYLVVFLMYFFAFLCLI